MIIKRKPFLIARETLAVVLGMKTLAFADGEEDKDKDPGGKSEEDKDKDPGGKSEEDKDKDPGGKTDDDDLPKDPTERLKVLEQRSKDRAAEAQELRAKLQKERTDSADIKKRLKELEDKDKSELEKTQGELKELREKAEKDARRAFESSVKAVAASLNFHDPGQAAKLLDLEADASDEDIDAAVKELAKKSPHLIKSKKDAEGGDELNPGGSVKEADRKKALEKVYAEGLGMNRK